MLEPQIWRIGSACAFSYLVIVLPVRVRNFFKVQSADASYSAAIFWTGSMVMVISAAIQAYNVIVLKAGWPFALAVVLEISIALLVFVRLLQDFQPALRVTVADVGTCEIAHRKAGH